MSLPSHLRDLLDRSNRLGIESPHAERLRQRVHAVHGFGDIYAELAEEMANALGRTAAKVDAALLECQVSDREGDEAAYEDARERARLARRDLFIHREALGMFDHSAVLDEYPLPPAWRDRGPKERR